jgi:hypothetical protein
VAGRNLQNPGAPADRGECPNPWGLFPLGTEIFTAADSGSATTQIVYEGYPGDASPVISGGVRVQNWTKSGGNTWKTTFPASNQYFESLFYNGMRRLRPRLACPQVHRWAPITATFVPNYLSGPNANCSEYFSGSGWECFDRFQLPHSLALDAVWRWSVSRSMPPSANV